MNGNSRHRGLMHVNRWAIMRTNVRQTVAEHSFFTALYASMILDKTLLQESTKRIIVQQALVHDIEECETGDIPGPVKKWLVKDEEVKRVRRQEASELGIQLQEDALTQWVIYVANTLDEVLFLLDEIGRGNQYFKRQYLESLGKIHTAMSLDHVPDEIYPFAGDITVLVHDLIQNEKDIMDLK